MQSSTILLAVAGIALFYYNSDNETIEKEIIAFIDFWDSSDISFIENFIIKETDCYKNGEYLLYETDNRLGITVITDTTERSPTFSLFPFENVNEKEDISLCAIFICLITNPVKKPGRSFYGEHPGRLNGPILMALLHGDRLLGFDFSNNVISRREQKTINNAAQV